MTVVIVGSGPVGLCTALSLQQSLEDDTKNTPVSIEVHEKAASNPKARRTGYNLNVTICERGLRALRYVGVADEVIRQSTVVVGVAVHTQHGGVNVFPYDTPGVTEPHQSSGCAKGDTDNKCDPDGGCAVGHRVLFSISRHLLVCILRRRVEMKGIDIVYGSKFICAQEDAAFAANDVHSSASDSHPQPRHRTMSAIFEVSESTATPTKSYSATRVVEGITLLVGADGVHSRVRGCLWGTKHLRNTQASKYAQTHQHVTIVSGGYPNLNTTRSAHNVSNETGKRSKVDIKDICSRRTGARPSVVYTHDVGYREVVLAGKLQAGSTYRNHLQIWCGVKGILLMLLPVKERTDTHIGVYAPLSYLETVSASTLNQDMITCAPELADLSVGPMGLIESTQFGSLHTVVCESIAQNGVILVGDAAHAMPPFLGQGLNSGLDDAYLLAQTISSKAKEKNGLSDEMLMAFSKNRIQDLEVILRKSHALMHVYSDEAVWGGNKIHEAADTSTKVMAREFRTNGSFFEQIAFTSKGYLSALEDSGEALPAPISLIGDLSGTSEHIPITSVAESDRTRPVAIGDHVAIGQVLYQTELVKTTVRILADKTGVVTHIHRTGENEMKNNLPKFVIDGTKQAYATPKTTTDQGFVTHDAQPSVDLAPGTFNKSLFLTTLRTEQLGRQLTSARCSTSTMEMARDVASGSMSGGRCHGHLCVADTMSSGRGRNGKQWRSSIEGNLYTTLIIKKPVQDAVFSEADLCSLQFAAAAAVVAVLRKMGANALIKWPNDIWVSGKKICGILVEADCSNTKRDKEDGDSVVFYVGIGVNLIQSMSFAYGCNEIVENMLNMTNLATGLGYILPTRVNDVSREIFLAELCNEFEPLWTLRLHDVIALHYSSFDLLVGRKIRVRFKNGMEREGMARGIDSVTGQLKMERCNENCGGEDCESKTINYRAHSEVKSATNQQRLCLREVVLVDSSFASVRPIPLETVYIYSSDSTSKLGVELLLRTFARVCDTTEYSIKSISPEELCLGAWRDDAAALVIGGGADLGYLRELSATQCGAEVSDGKAKPDGIEIIRSYVHAGGVYIGVCAGAYMACGRVLFDEGGALEVVGNRPLKFFTGDCVGPVVGEYDYSSEKGARAVKITWTEGDGERDEKGARENTPESDQSAFVYVNGGGAFLVASPSDAGDEDTDRTNLNRSIPKSYEVLARYDSEQIQPAYKGSAAIIFARTDEPTTNGDSGKVLLMGPHLEFHPEYLNADDVYLSRPNCLPRLQKSARQSDRLLQRLLEDKCGLKV
ncbi:hypothetical protein SARC_04979 [Sphaeroforma arctica JP610]|uniref:BPL/LPL catalytic domain-containing protein n=1 Tax=Sphaeroforma arctica JP610 TaxID=667725 RepID=A0A0L0G3G5_9EUKA|nr:hypothetical protein SARC_04979 [Sphaeroforma arctica JP610]KNC82738.1 hypothetical protein SARC_04979 [Sphaeroforma arctica JP610]|eukprot:XP_014156640.1 hypothetical protein SARC_04979 [Sphaeroforma arctica JP610]